MNIFILIICLLLVNVVSYSQEVPTEVPTEAVVNYTDKLYKYYTAEEKDIYMLLMCSEYYSSGDGKGDYYAKYAPKFLVSVKERAKKSRVDWKAMDKRKRLTLFRAGLMVRWKDICMEVIEVLDYEYDNPRGL